MTDPGSAFDLGVAIAHQLSRRNVSYALGGALALGAAGLPRGTLDVDINVFVGPNGLAPVFDALRAVGASLDDGRAGDEAVREGMFNAWVGAYRVDVFVPSIPFSWEAERTKLPVNSPSGELYFLSAEALSVFKLLFFRTKDLADLEQLVALRPDLDVRYVREKLVEMMGETDPRVERWDRIVESAHGAL